MRLFFDENLSPVVVEPLRPLFGATHELHSIFTYDGGQLQSDEDDPLIAELSHDFDVLVTQDRSQLRNHREALLDSGLHWIGLRQPKVSNLHGLAATTACLLAGMPHAIDEIESWGGMNGCWTNLRGLQREASQPIDVRNKPRQTNSRRLRRSS